MIPDPRVAPVVTNALRQLVRRPVLDAVGDIGTARCAVVHVERALVPDLHVVRAGDVGRRRVPRMRADPVRAPRALPAIIQTRDVAVGRAAGGRRALFRDLNETSIVARTLTAVPIRQVCTQASLEQELVGRGATSI